MRCCLSRVRFNQRQFNLRQKQSKALINRYSLVVDALILHDLVDSCCEKSPDKLMMKMVIIVWKNGQMTVS